jgi:Holliday junction resolvasome RuvABC endonuclease subunit
MKILGLDCATKTGWAITDSNGNIIESGIMDFSKRRGETNGILFLRFRKWLKDMIVLNHPDVLAYEQAHHRGGAATEICVGLTTRVLEAGAFHNIECLPLRTTEIKKFATGKGNAGKPEMIAAAKNILHRDPLSDDEADAVFVAKLAAQEVGA